MSGFTPPSDPVVLVESNEEVAADFYRLRLSHPEAAGKVAPGQFVQLQVGGGVAPLLRVPLSVSAADSQTGTIEVLFEDMGPKTFLLSRAREGDRLRLPGAAGDRFSGSASGRGSGGGEESGFPRCCSWANACAAGTRCVFLWGAREAAKLLPEELLSSAASEHRIATDDGSAGQRGFATDLLIEELDAFSPVTVYTCGPPAMMAAVAQICGARGIACFASLEEYMACGFGVCVGCVVPRAEAASPYCRYSRVCFDGPVYDAREIAWENVHSPP